MPGTAFLFPGQGSQEVGMAADLFKGDSYFLNLVGTGSDFVGEDLTTACRKGPEPLLARARILQPLIVAISLAYHRRIVDAGIAARVVLGHSLGEITSLAAAGIVSAPDAVRIAGRRGQLMDEAAERTPGGLLAALFMSLDTVAGLLDELGQAGRIVMANDNADDQIVLSGDRDMLQQFARMVRDRKLGKTFAVNVSGPWHSPYMQSGREVFERWVEPLAFAAPAVPIIMNATARAETDPRIIKRLSSGQLTSPVYWRQSMKALHDLGVDTLLEIGPGRILAGLARVNGFRTARIFSVNNLQGVQRAVDALVIDSQELGEQAGIAARPGEHLGLQRNPSVKGRS